MSEQEGNEFELEYSGKHVCQTSGYVVLSVGSGLDLVLNHQHMDSS